MEFTKFELNFIPFTNYKSLAFYKVKAFTDNIIYYYSTHPGENTFGDGENFCNQQFLLFPTMFSKGFFLNSLPHNHNFLDPCIRTLLKTLLEKKKMLVTTISSFSTMFSTLPKTNFNFSVMFILSFIDTLNRSCPELCHVVKG